MGFPFFTHGTKANLSDDAGLVEMLTNNIEYFRAKPVNIPKITILLDNGYHPEKLMEKLRQVYPQIITKIRFELSPKPSKSQKKKDGKTGFVPVKAKWVIERSNSWMERCKSAECTVQQTFGFKIQILHGLIKNFERTLAHAATKINLCFVRLMLKRLANP